MDHTTHYTYPVMPAAIPYQQFFSYSPSYSQISPPQTDYCVALDLSKKRPQTPCYTYNYPSPKSSPTHVSPTPSSGCQTTINQTTSPKSLCGSDVSETSFCSSSDLTTSPKSRIRATRPFKAFPKDPLCLSLGAVSRDTSSVMLHDSLERSDDSDITKFLIGNSMKAYSEYRQKMIEKITHDTGTNKNMRRTQHQNEKCNDQEYLEKRKKNNEAAKKSRDARRQKQDEIAIRVTFLEQENMMLRYKIESEKEDLERLQKSQRL